MAEEWRGEPDEPEIPTGPGVEFDRVFTALTVLVGGYAAGLYVTVVTSGLPINGELITERRYLKEFFGTLSSGTNPPVLAEGIAYVGKTFEADLAENEATRVAAPSAFFHLRDARFVSTRFAPGAGFLVRIRLDSISAFSMGQLNET